MYASAVINLRAKITYGPQMLRSVFLRFPLFIHTAAPPRHYTGVRRTTVVPGDRRGERNARAKEDASAGTRTYTARHDGRRCCGVGGGWHPSRRAGETDNIFAEQKTAPAAVADLRRCEPAAPSRPAVPSRVRRRQLHRPGPARTRSHWPGGNARATPPRRRTARGY